MLVISLAGCSAVEGAVGITPKADATTWVNQAGQDDPGALGAICLQLANDYASGLTHDQAVTALQQQYQRMSSNGDLPPDAPEPADLLDALNTWCGQHPNTWIPS